MRRCPGETFKRPQKVIRAQTRLSCQAGEIVTMLRIALEHPNYPRYTRKGTGGNTGLARGDAALQ